LNKKNGYDEISDRNTRRFRHIYRLLGGEVDYCTAGKSPMEERKRRYCAVRDARVDGLFLPKPRLPVQHKIVLRLSPYRTSHYRFRFAGVVLPERNRGGRVLQTSAQA